VSAPQLAMERQGANAFQFVYMGQRFTFMNVHPSDHISALMKRTNTFYEVDVLEKIRDRLNSQGKKGVAIDVGAFVGTHSVYLARVCHFTQVMAYEPDPDSFETLRKNLYLNGVENRVACVNKAAGGRRGNCALVRPDPFNRGSSCLRYGSDDGVVTAQVITLDEEFGDQQAKRIQLIKIDVEGCEVQVLRGARRIIREHRPLLSIEAHTTSHLLHLLGILQKEGYAIIDCLGASPTYILEFCITKRRARRLAAAILWVLRSLVPDQFSALRWYFYRIAKAVL
jgi:FkbM family methyltransferase